MLEEYGKQIGLAWAMSVTRPNFYDLNPLKVYETYYDQSQGNPFLTPSYENRIEVNYNNNKDLYANLYYTHGKDQIDWITFIHPSSTTASPENIYKSNKTGLYINYRHHFSQRVNAIAEGELFYYDADGNYDNTIGNDGWGKRFSISGDVILNRQHTLILNARYDQWLDDYVGFTKIDAYGYFSFALRYSLLNDRLKLSLTAVDPFHQQIKDKTMRFNYHHGENQKVHTNLHSHYIGLTATYSLGGKKVRQTHHDFNNSETKRAEKQ